MNINIREGALINNTGRFHFIAKEHSFSLLNFLKTNDESDKSHFDKDEEKEYEKKFRYIFSKLQEEIIPIDDIISLTSDIESRPIICTLDEIKNVTLELNKNLPTANCIEKQCIFNLFQVLMFNSKILTDILIDNSILENICITLLDENISDEGKIPPVKCIHYIAEYGNPQIIFDPISFIYQNVSYREPPFDCMVRLINDQDQKLDSDETVRKIRECCGRSFELDNTMNLRLLILKFIVAILNCDNLPQYPSQEIVDYIIDATIQFSESVITKDVMPLKFLDTAAFGCFLAVMNENTKSCFLSTFKQKNEIMNFINILNNNKEYPNITPSILLCLKYIIEDNPKEAETFYKYNIVRPIKHHIENDKYPIVCENAIQTLISFFVADKEHFFKLITEEKIPEILYENLEASCFTVKITSLHAIYEIIKDFSTSEVWSFINEFSEIFERCCLLLPSEIDYDSFNLITQTAIILAEAYNKAGENEKLIDICKTNEIDIIIDNFEIDADLKTQNLARQLKRIITLEDENEESDD